MAENALETHDTVLHATNTICISSTYCDFRFVRIHKWPRELQNDYVKLLTFSLWFSSISIFIIGD